MRSGTTPYGSSADQVPVRPAPVSTSSATAGHRAGRRPRAPGASTAAAAPTRRSDEPPTGSAMTAATVSGPSRTSGRLDRLPAAGRAERQCAPAFAPVGVRRRHPDDVHQPGAKERLVVLARRRRRAPGVCSRDTGLERDDRLPGRLPHLHPVLPRQLECRLDGLRAARERVHEIEIPGRKVGDLRGQLLHRVVGEGHAVDIPQPAGLRADASAISSTPWPRFATNAPPLPSR